MRLCFIGDVHSQFNKLQKAVDYALSQNLTIVFLGDVFDSRVDDYSNSIGVYHLVKSLVNSGHYCLNSNHQDKFIRYLKGNQVTLNNGLDVTVKEFEEAAISKEEILEFLTSLPYGIVCKNSLGQQFRCAHAYFPDTIEIPEFDDVYCVYGNSVNRYTRKVMIYGPLDKERKRVLWWENLDKHQNFIRVSGHYHTVFVDDYSIVIDGGCGSGGCICVYNTETGCLKEF